ncbi:LOW QUALITY PROTEIN: leucine-rich repeat-containing protein 9 [Guaruba guarouba]
MAVVSATPDLCTAAWAGKSNKEFQAISVTFCGNSVVILLETHILELSLLGIQIFFPNFLEIQTFMDNVGGYTADDINVLFLRRYWEITAENSRDDASDNQNQNLEKIITELVIDKRIIVVFHFWYTYKGLTYENIDQDGLKTTALKMFSLALSQNSIPLLRKHKMNGPQKSVNLQIFFYCNEVSRVENLEALTKLNLLLLNNNLIKNTELECELAKLQTLGKTSSNRSLRSKNLETENSDHDNEDTEKTWLGKTPIPKRQVPLAGILVVRPVITLETFSPIPVTPSISGLDGFSQIKMFGPDFNLCGSLTGNKAFLLCNSLSICECPRTEFLKQQAEAEGKASSDPGKSLKHVQRSLSVYYMCNIIVEEEKRSPERFILSHDLQRDDEVLNMEMTVKVSPQDISRLKTLRKFITNFNEFTSFNNIHDLPSPEYFDASHSHMMIFEGIRDLSKLQFSNLSWNKLKKPKAAKVHLGVGMLMFENLPYFHHTSTENNKITSLAGLNKTDFLVELYTNTWKQDHYQLSVLFHHPSLKAFDGTAAINYSVCKLALAFGVRVKSIVYCWIKNCEFVVRFFIRMLLLYPISYPKASMAWICSCSISNFYHFSMLFIFSVLLVLTDQFRNVFSVNLHNNNLMSFSGIFIPNAKVLCLSYTHIEPILPGQKSPNQVTKRQQLYKVASHGYGQQALAKGNSLKQSQGFSVANSPEDSGFPALPANFTRHNHLRITNGNLNENIKHLFGSDLVFGHELEVPLVNKSNERSVFNQYTCFFEFQGRFTDTSKQDDYSNHLS